MPHVITIHATRDNYSCHTW